MKSKFTPYLILLLLLLQIFPAFVMAMDVTLAWDPNTDSTLAGYRIYARESGEAYNYGYPEWEGTDTQVTLQGFDEYESYYFVVRAFDSEGNESGDSNEVYLPSDYSSDNGLDNGGTSGGGSGGGGGGCFIDTLFSN